MSCWPIDWPVVKFELKGKTLTRVKVCGITNLEDAMAAIELGSSALGFIMVPSSPRYIGENSDALQIPLHLPPFISTVAVCEQVPTGQEEWFHHFTAVQFYNGLPPVEPATGRAIVQAFRIKDESSVQQIFDSRSTTDAFLLDAYSPDTLGGTGHTFNWELARQVRERAGRPIILAGGLTPENVGEAIRIVHPYAVDVSSGVEHSPGKKDAEKMAAFFAAVWEADEVGR